MPSEIPDAPASQNDPMDQDDNDHDDEVDDEEIPVVAVAMDEEDDEEEEEVLAAVVLADNEDDLDDAVPVVAVSAEPTPKKKKKSQSASTTTTPKSTPSAKASGASKASATTSTKKKKKKSTPSGPNSSSSALHISPLYLEAASEARAMLQETVPSLPMPIADITVRSFGRLLIDASPNNFSTTAALYPIGFSCDRQEFSPVHGRVLKLRCSILDGRKFDPAVPGPLFRITWGPGIDNDESSATTDHPFDPSVHAPPLNSSAATDHGTGGSGGGNSGGVTQTKSTTGARQLLPEIGMRVKVRLEKSVFVNGTIVAASTDAAAAAADAKKKKRKAQIHVTIRYDEGFTEESVYPDPDIELLLPGMYRPCLFWMDRKVKMHRELTPCPIIAARQGDEPVDASGDPVLKQINGKPVSCVVDKSPLEAWGKALVQLGLVDEIICELALDSVKKLREDSLQKAREKLQQTHSNPGSHSKSFKRERAGSYDTDGIPTALNSRASTPVPSSRHNGDGTPEEQRKVGDAEDANQDDDVEPPSERELYLRRRVDELKEDLDDAVEESQHAALELADARIGLLGPFLCNPFRLDESSKAQQVSWMATAVKKEKMRMGSTGKLFGCFQCISMHVPCFDNSTPALIRQ